MDLFKEILPSILEKKSLLDRDSLDKSGSGYNQYIINKALMQYHDTLFDAQAMNLMDISNKQHYDYLYNKITHGKRFAKWSKADKEKDDDIAIISEYYDCSKKRAKEILNIITDNELKIIRKRLYKGDINGRPI